MLKDFFHNTARFARETWENRTITVQLAWQGVIKKHKGTALGTIWLLVTPLAYVFMFWFAIEIGLRGARNIGHDFPFVLWLIPAIFAWRTITDAIGSGGNSVRSNSSLVTKVKFPTITIPQFAITSLFMIHLAVMLLAMGIFIAAGYMPTIYWLQLIYAIGINFIFCLVVATLLSAIAVFSRDVTQLVRTIMIGLFWFSAIIWPLANLEGTIASIVRLNPIVYVTQVYRWSMIYDTWFWEHPMWTAYFWGLLLVLIVITLFVWSKTSRYFADVL